MDSRQRRWDSHGAWRTRGGKALKPVGTVAAEWFRVFQFIRATDGRFLSLIISQTGSS
jgi:hypothetical protein